MFSSVVSPLLCSGLLSLSSVPTFLYLPFSPLFHVHFHQCPLMSFPTQLNLNCSVLDSRPCFSPLIFPHFFPLPTYVALIFSLSLMSSVISSLLSEIFSLLSIRVPFPLVSSYFVSDYLSSPSPLLSTFLPSPLHIHMTQSSGNSKLLNQIMTTDISKE